MDLELNLKSPDNQLKLIKCNADEINLIREQSTKILSNGGKVFYNPVQEFNRDLSVSVLNLFIKTIKLKKTNFDGIRILEALSATGLRSIRYAKEIPDIKEIIANDISKSAVETIQSNIKYNNVETIVKANQADATTLMYLSTEREKRYDVIDLDPYGCPNKFLDGAIQSIADGGMLLVTATDMAVLAGNAPEACFSKYGAISLRIKACHEMAIRILLRTIEEHANRYGRYIEPLLSVSADFYIRVFVLVHTGQFECKYSMSKQSLVHACTGCETLTLQPLGILKPNPTQKNPHQVKFCLPTGPNVNTNCCHCNHKHHTGGPIYSAPIHSLSFVNELLAEAQQKPLVNLGTSKRIIGMLTVISEELLDVPLYYSIDKICSLLKMEIIPVLKFRSALLHAGYKVSYSHAYKNSIKTSAPSIVLWDILRCWNKIHPVKTKRFIEGTPVALILSKEAEIEYNLTDIHPDANPKSRKEALSRFPENPTPHWGPGTRSTMMIGADKLMKSYRNQNKKQKSKEKNADEHEKIDSAKKVKFF